MFKQLGITMIFVLLGTAGQGHAQTSMERLVVALQMPEVFEVMVEEGAKYGTGLDDQMLEGRGGDEWAAVVGDIYSPDKMMQMFLPDFEAAVPAGDIDAMVAFFETAQGSRIITLEVSARRALLDESIEELSHEILRVMRESENPRYELLTEFIEINDLVDFNVMGALNANYSFYMGLIEGRAFDQTIVESEVLRDVWEQEPEVREDSKEWLYSYLAMAYQPLSDADLRDYIAFSKSDAGKALNAALFKGFDRQFNEISRQLGVAVSKYMQGEDI